MSPLIDDIQEELRREDFFNALKKQFPWIVGMVVLILMAAAGYTWMQWHKEKTLVHYEAVCDKALQKIAEKDDAGAEKLLQEVAEKCPGLEFYALMTLANLHKTHLIQMTEGPVKTGSQHAPDPQQTLETRKKLAVCDYQLFSIFPDSQFRHFLSLCRFMLDAQQAWSYFGPSPLGNYQEEKTGSMVPVPLSDQDVSNSLNLYSDIPAWSALSMAVKVISFPKDSPEQHKALKEWIRISKSRLPLLVAMGLAEDLHR